jgi:hypothetical protein
LHRFGSRWKERNAVAGAAARALAPQVRPPLVGDWCVELALLFSLSGANCGAKFDAGCLRSQHSYVAPCVVRGCSVLCWAFAWNAFPHAAATTGIRLPRRPSRLLAAKAAPGDRLLWTEGLNKMYTPDRYQLKDVSLTLTSGQRAGLVGINGAGKVQGCIRGVTAAS